MRREKRPGELWGFKGGRVGAQIRSLQEPTLALVNSAFSCDSFPTPHRPTKLLIEPAVCKSLKILEVASRALASLLITERGICGNRAESRAAAEATRATSLRFSLGNRQKKSQLIRVGTLSIGGQAGNQTVVRMVCFHFPLNRKCVMKCTPSRLLHGSFTRYSGRSAGGPRTAGHSRFRKSRAGSKFNENRALRFIRLLCRKSTRCVWPHRPKPECLVYC